MTSGVRKFGEGVQLQLLQLEFWLLVMVELSTWFGLFALAMVWTFSLVFGYSLLVR
jgi:hypothetical protein